MKDSFRWSCFILLPDIANSSKIEQLNNSQVQIDKEDKSDSLCLEKYELRDTKKATVGVLKQKECRRSYEEAEAVGRDV